MDAEPLSHGGVSLRRPAVPAELGERRVGLQSVPDSYQTQAQAWRGVTGYHGLTG